MTIQTRCADRRAMVQAISEHLSTPAVYLRTPTYAFQIGEIQVERDASVIGPDDAVNALIPFLQEQGYMEQASLQPAEEAAMDENTTPLTETIQEHPDVINIQISVPAMTVPQMKNFLRLVCSKQYVIQKMLQADTPRIDRDFADEISRSEFENAEDFAGQIQRGIEEGLVHGFSISEHSAQFTVPFVEANTPRWMSYSLLLMKMEEHIRQATRIQLAVEQPENEKYVARALLQRLGFGGVEYKEARHVLLDHLHGYAAFKDDAGMQAHKDRLAAKRRAAKEDCKKDD